MSWLSFIQPKASCITLQFKDLRILWRQKPFYRNLMIRLKSDDQIVLTSGRKTSQRVIENFLIEKESWIRRHIQILRNERLQNPAPQIVDEQIFPFLGKNLKLKIQITMQNKYFVIHNDQELLLFVPENVYHQKDFDKNQECFAAIQSFYKKQAEQILYSQVKTHSARMQLVPAKVSFRNQKTRWGSCNSKGHISLNWKLVCTSIEIIDSIVIHELSHLKHMNHSAEFWNLVSKFDPNYKRNYQQLNQLQKRLEFLL